MSGCGDDDSAGETAAQDAPASDRCEDVPRALVDAIATGLTVQGGGTLRQAQAVKSEDFDRVYFVSAEIDGAGLEGSGDIGTWAKSGPLESEAGWSSPSTRSQTSSRTGATEARRTPS